MSMPEERVTPPAHGSGGDQPASNGPVDSAGGRTKIARAQRACPHCHKKAKSVSPKREGAK